MGRHRLIHPPPPGFPLGPDARRWPCPSVPRGAVGTALAHRARDRGAADVAQRWIADRGPGMTAIAPQPIISRPSPVHVAAKGSRLSSLLRTTDHKTIGLM